MNLEKFIENFAGIFDDTDISELKPETIFKNLDEWSSLMALSLIAMVDEEYDVRLKGDDIRSTDTIEDIFILLKSKI